MHGHGDAYSPLCEDCGDIERRILAQPPILWMDRLDERGRPVPGGRLVAHVPRCPCQACAPPFATEVRRGFRETLWWLWINLWCWTRTGESLYWAAVGLLLWLYS